MQIPKPTEADKDYFRSLVPEAPDVEMKPMFGNLGAFVNGNMFAGLFGAAVGVRLSDPDRHELAAIDEAGPFGPEERPMGGYLSLPPAFRKDSEQAAGWVARAHSYVSEMPPKKTKPKASPKAAKPK